MTEITNIDHDKEAGTVCITYGDVTVEVLNDETDELEEIIVDMLVKFTDEGMIIDIVEPKTGEVIMSAWQLVDDLVAMTH